MSLQERIDRNGPLALHEILRIGMQTAAGLAAAHAQGLIHRDIKPANILLENGVERVKITDFGLARAAADASVSQSGIVAGTPQYMAPEQARGEALDCRTDLFSLGGVLYAMCSGRAPFRAANSMAVLKRVCDDAPSPIREANADIPDWLIAVIDKLQAKNADDRYQSAAEVANLLGQRLVQLQHSTPLPPLAAHKPAASWPTAQRWRTWPVAAAILLGLAATLGMAEGTGATKIAATVIRLLTPEGTLVVEVTDPRVKVTIEGDGGLVITGAGLHEVHLKPGSYKLQADKNGQPVPLERERVSIAQGGREVVRVKMETSPAAAIAKVEQDAFVLLGSKGIAERKFDTLAEAVQGASNGDTIEIRGNGPFVSGPISIQQNAITIRAGAGFRPVIKLRPEAIHQNVPLLTTKAALVLEGLELHRALPEGTQSQDVGRRRVFHAQEGALWSANCRFRASVWVGGPLCVLRNCEVFGEHANISIQHRPSSMRLLVDNCLHRTWSSTIYFQFLENPTLHDKSIEVRRTTMVGEYCSVWLGLQGRLPAVAGEPPTVPPIRVQIAGTIFDTRHALGFGPTQKFLEQASVPQPPAAEAALLRLLQWRGERNVFATGNASVLWRSDQQTQLPGGPRSLRDWKAYWSSPETDSLEGRLRFQGGNILSRTDLDQLTPEDFRLREGSPGYRVGTNGKDLGADVDLVGPGPAYERWKKTLEYQDWLKETGQIK